MSSLPIFNFKSTEGLVYVGAVLIKQVLNKGTINCYACKGFFNENGKMAETVAMGDAPVRSRSTHATCNATRSIVRSSRKKPREALWLRALTVIQAV
jgi:hypothetical protein